MLANELWSYMNDKLFNKVITISSKEEMAGQYGAMAKIRDENNFIYTVYQQKKDGTTSAAWEQLKNLFVGMAVQIGYVEQIREYEGKNYTARTIRNFDKDIANGIVNTGRYQGSQMEQSPHSEAPSASQGHSRDFDKEAIGKCQSLFLQGYIQAGHTFAETLLQVAQARRLAEVVVYGRTENVAPDIQMAAEQMAHDELVTVQQGEDLNVEDIPY
jgi:hypothetical protein